MNKNITETYTEDGNKLLDLIQNWIDENNFFYFKNSKKVVQDSRWEGKNV